MVALMGLIEAVISQTSRISKRETRGKIRICPVALFSFHELRVGLWDAILPFPFLLENILCEIGKVELCVIIAIFKFFFLFIIFVVFFLFLVLAVCPFYDSRESSTSWYFFFFLSWKWTIFVIHLVIFDIFLTQQQQHKQTPSNVAAAAWAWPQF